MEYIKVKWLHASPSYPTEIYSEVDNNRFEVRKIEVYLDGTINYFDSVNNNQGLGTVPIPSVEEIMKQEDFLALKIDKSFFDLVWSKGGK